MNTKKARFTFVRHGQTGQAEKNWDRPLTEVGRQQAERLRDLLGGGDQFDLVLHSPTPRTTDMAQIIAGGTDQRIQAVPELYGPEGEDGDTLFALYAQLGSSTPLRRFLEEDDTGALTRFAINGADTVLELVEEFGAENILIVGHAVLLQAIAAAIGGFFSLDDNELRDLVLGEGEAFTLEPDGRIVVIRQPTN